MKTYSLSEQGLARLRRRFIQRMSVILVIIGGVVVAINIWRAGDKWPVYLIVSLVVVGGILVYSLTRGLQQNVDIWKSIKIKVGEDFVSRSQVRVPEVSINRGEITTIDEVDGGICIRTKDKTRSLAIPAGLDDSEFQEVRRQLASWAPIRPQSSNTRAQGAFLLVILLIGFGIIFVSSSLWLVLGVGLALTGYYGYFYWTIYRAKGVDPQFRKNMALAVVFPIFITAIKVCALSGGYLSF